MIQVTSEQDRWIRLSTPLLNPLQQLTVATGKPLHPLATERTHDRRQKIPDKESA